MPIEFHRDGPWELPEAWVWARLGDVCKHPGRIDPARQLTGTFRYIDLSAIDDGKVAQSQNLLVAKAPSRARQPVQSGDTLLSCVRVYLRNNAIVPDELDGSVGSTAFCILRPSEAIDPRYLFWFVHSRKFTEILIPLQRGNSPPAVLDEDVRDQLVPVPPLPEQRRIVARIDELFTEIADGEASLARARDDLDTWRRALLKAAVTGELTREWREQNSPIKTGGEIVERLRRANPNIKSTQRGWSVNQGGWVPQIPQTWAWCAVEEAGEVQLGRQRAPQHHAGEHMRPYLRVANILEDALDLSDVKRMNFTPEEFGTFVLRSGDILLNEGQTPELLGRPAVYSGEIEECCFQKTLIRFRSNTEVLPQFALIVFRHYMRSGRFKRESRITTNMAHLTQVRFVVMEFPVPPTEEQAEIVRQFRTLEGDAVEQFDHVEWFNIAGLRYSILRAAFEGHLVEQDLRDEPAEQLLVRLSERADTHAQPRRASRKSRATLAAE